MLYSHIMGGGEEEESPVDDRVIFCGMSVTLLSKECD